MTMRRWMTLMAACCWVSAVVADTAASTSFDWDIWRKIVVLDGGRTKPMDTLAWEQIYKFAGRSKFEPAAVALVSTADVKDWTALAKTLTNAESTKSLAFPSDLVEAMTKTSFETASLEREIFAIDAKLDERLESYVKKAGVAKTRRQFLAETTDAEDRQLLDSFDATLRKLDDVGSVKLAMLHHLNEWIMQGDMSAAKKNDSSENTVSAAVAKRREIEKLAGESLRPITDKEVDAGRLRYTIGRKYDPVELAVTLALTWQGWDKTDDVRKLFEEGRDLGFAKVYWQFHEADIWDATPMIDGRYQELAPRLLPETSTAVSVRSVQENRWFVEWALRAVKLQEDKATKKDLNTADEKAVNVLDAYRAFVLLRSGQTIHLAPDANVKSRIDHIQSLMDALRAKVGSLKPAEAAKEIETWKASLKGDPHASDLTEIADRAAKELKVQEYSESPTSASVLLEQQTRLRVEEIANDVRWLTLLEILAMPDRVKSQGYDDSTAVAMRRDLIDAREALLAGDAAKFNAASASLAQTLQKAGGQSHLYPTADLIATELHYNRFQPFLKTAILSGIALILLAVSLGMTGSLVYSVGFVTLLAATAMMMYGTALRITISGRPPVTNMYETIIWASFIMTSLAIVLGAVYRHRVILLTAAMVLTPATLLAYVMPPEFGSSINPLVPVLRDNFWLIIHVLTIVASYGAFMLAWMLGNVGLAYYLTGRGESANVKPIALFIYRAIQVGVLLLAAGTILGGWWAAYSWGRFWGWDPKEVWALIALLGYLAVLHARFAGLVKTFGLIASSVLAFAGVVMSWYGVNFVLGEGLHAYAFGDGGQPYVFGVVLANLGYLVLVIFVHQVRQSQRRSAAEIRSAEVASVG
jgi:ABC-type transport system involved in cytochrome c biogenesis permease subunit